MKKIGKITATVMALVGALGFAACGNGEEKNITVIAREQGSGTREAFDKVVTDGEHFLMEKVDGKEVFYTTKKASLLSKTEVVTATVANDKNAIGYISLGSVDDRIKVIDVGGVTPSAETVLAGDYQIQRPFVIMTNEKVALNARTADFMNYLYSSEMIAHAEAAGCIFLQDPAMRANEGETGIEVLEYEKQATLPDGGKIVIRGSTSMEMLITVAAVGYAAEYGVDGGSIFDIQLEGSSVGKKAVKEDTNGNVIGLSSASVNEAGINSFNVCLDAVAVIVNKNNTAVNDLTLKQLYDIFSGKITKFSEIA